VAALRSGNLTEKFDAKTQFLLMTTPTFASGVIVGWYFVVIKMQLLTDAKIGLIESAELS